MRHTCIWLYMLLASATVLSAGPTSFAQDAPPQKCLKIGSYTDYGERPMQIASLYVSKMYKLAGICINYVAMPSKRSSELLMAGELDGEILRAGEAIEAYGQTAYVLPQHLFEFNLQMGWLDNSAFSGRRDDLPKVKVGLLAGDIFAGKVLGVKLPTTIKLNSIESAGQLLMRGRVDALVTNPLALSLIQQSLAEKNTVLRIANISQIKIYHILHRRHIDKAEALTLAYKLALRSDELQAHSQQNGIQLPEIHR